MDSPHNNGKIFRWHMFTVIICMYCGNRIKLFCFRLRTWGISLYTASIGPIFYYITQRLVLVEIELVLICPTWYNKRAGCEGIIKMVGLFLADQTLNGKSKELQKLDMWIFWRFVISPTHFTATMVQEGKKEKGIRQFQLSLNKRKFFLQFV